MVGFPYDDLNQWRAIYPAEVLRTQFEKITVGWQEGLAILDHAQNKATAAVHRANLQIDHTLAEAAGLHFRSVANQIRFVMSRDALLSGSLPPNQRKAYSETARNTLQDEIRTASRLFALTLQDSRIGYEASNHYYYLPLDLVEKVINCQHILDTAFAEADGL